ncbi:MAG TPA: tRNA (adenosine(37)-N6)-dimethylallyltransferase MiaA [Thermodesulfovibrionales bacterium]|nr:tRNA (adenosine(37)-N6)-dimethylallyltransferase MiaA [Thermodesulfovibrionales bacterium]
MTNTVIILLGPTGVGKSSVSVLLAEVLNTEIISADSMQIYRHMNIGTGKPTVEERTMVKHYMIDIVNPWEAYSTGKYIEAVVPIMEKLHRKGKVPIVVGGTGLYIKAMTRGIFSGPSADWSLRDNLLALEKEEKGSLYNFLKDIDLVTAERITPNDTRRIIRALEVCLKSDSSMSELQKKMTKPLPYDFIKIGLCRDRKELYRLIEQRVDNMIREGLVEEVKMVVDMIGDAETGRHGDTEKERISDSPNLRFSDSALPSMQAIGYKEIALYLEGEITLEEAIRLIKKRSKRYAKRQFTWFKKEEDIHWIDITGIYDANEIFMRTKHVLNELLY